jgi:flagellar hook protein FlgE
MAIQGNGYFLVEQGDQEELTRAGNFTLDSSGNMMTQSGQNVMGYQATNGAVSSSSVISALNIPTGSIESAHATSNISMDTNLDSSATGGTSFATSMTVYDSLGASHDATVTFTQASPTSWNYAITLPAADYTGSATNNTGTLTFNPNGTLATPTSNISGISFSKLSDGAADLSFKWSLYDANGSPTISTSATASSVSTSNQDGYTSGQYTGFSVDTTGVISATYDNGHSQAIGQLAIANVSNPSGLAQSGGNSYLPTLASGDLSTGAAGQGGRGTIESDALEQSNVDISTEFANLIVAQRAFEANSKAVTTFDSVTQETINMIR